MVSYIDFDSEYLIMYRPLDTIACVEKQPEPIWLQANPWVPAEYFFQVDSISLLEMFHQTGQYVTICQPVYVANLLFSMFAHVWAHGE